MKVTRRAHHPNRRNQTTKKKGRTFSKLPCTKRRMTLVLPHLAFPTTRSLHVEAASPLARLAARSAAVVSVLGCPATPSAFVGEEAERGTFCGYR